MLFRARRHRSGSLARGRWSAVTTDFARRTLFGLRFIDAPHIGEIGDALLERRGGDPLAEDAIPMVLTPNVDILVHLDRDDCPRAGAVMRRATYVIADGQPVVWASRILGRPLLTRLAGSDLVADLWPRLARDGRHVLVVAASHDVAKLLRAEHARATVVVAPMLPADDDAAVAAFAKECVAACGEQAPELVFVALGYPKAYLLVDELAALWADAAEPPVHLAIGASFEMYFGLRKRSPEWIQRIGMEWFFRFVQEPRRLFRRYFVDDVAFVRLVWREHRMLQRSGHPSMRRARPAGRVLPGPWLRASDAEEDVAQPAG